MSLLKLLSLELGVLTMRYYAYRFRFLTRISFSIINRAIDTDDRRMMVSHLANVVVNCCFVMVFDTAWEADFNSALVRPIHGSHKVKLRASEHVGYYS